MKFKGERLVIEAPKMRLRSPKGGGFHQSKRVENRSTQKIKLKREL